MAKLPWHMKADFNSQRKAKRLKHSSPTGKTRAKGIQGKRMPNKSGRC